MPDFRVGLEKIKARLSVKSRARLYVVLGVLWVAVTACCVFLLLMPFNLSSGLFKLYLVFTALLWSVPLALKPQGGRRPRMRGPWGIPAFAAIALLVAYAACAFASSPLFTARGLAGFVEIADPPQAEVTLSVDRATAVEIGRQLLERETLDGEYVCDADRLALSVYLGRPYWVAPLEHKKMRSGPVPAYLRICATDAADAVLVRQTLSYAQSCMGTRDLNRKIYFSNPTLYRAKKPHLELDEQGRPYYIDTVLSRRYLFFNGLDRKGVTVTDAITGETVYYPREKIPDWVDGGLIELVDRQLVWKAKYRDGFWAFGSRRDVADRRVVFAADRLYYKATLGEETVYVRL